MPFHESIYNRLSECGIKRLRNLRIFTKKDLLNGRYFGKETLIELEGVIIKYDACLKAD